MYRSESGSPLEPVLPFGQPEPVMRRGTMLVLAVAVLMLAITGGTAFFVLQQEGDSSASRPASSRNDWPVIIDGAAAASDAVGTARKPDKTPRAAGPTKPGAGPGTGNDAKPRTTPGAGKSGGTAGGDGPMGTFLTKMTDEKLTFRVDCTGTVSAGNEDFDFDIQMDVAGTDFSGSMAFTQGRVTFAADMVSKSGTSYLKLKGASWEVLEGGSAGMPDVNPLADVRQNESLEYVGLVTRGGRSVHHYRAPKELTDLGGSFLDEYGGGATVDDLVIDFYVKSDGTPVAAAIVFEGSVTAAGVEMQLGIDVEYAFSDFGAPIRIRAPRVDSSGDSSS